MLDIKYWPQGLPIMDQEGVLCIYHSITPGNHPMIFRPSGELLASSSKLSLLQPEDTIPRGIIMFDWKQVIYSHIYIVDSRVRYISHFEEWAMVANLINMPPQTWPSLPRDKQDNSLSPIACLLHSNPYGDEIAVVAIPPYVISVCQKQDRDKSEPQWTINLEVKSHYNWKDFVEYNPNIKIQEWQYDTERAILTLLSRYRKAIRDKIG